MSLYVLNRIKKSYGDREILNIPELRLENRKVYALLGANGTGKTTLLQMLAFLEPPTSGSLVYQSKRVDYSVGKALKKLRRKVSLLDQSPILFSTSVFKNLEYGLKIRKIAKAERKRRIEEALFTVKMTEFMHAQAVNLSGGETQRVALARVLVLKPEVLLCDEPTSSVDRENQAIIIHLLKKLNEEQGISILFSTHDRRVASALAHETIDLDGGGLGSQEIWYPDI